MENIYVFGLNSVTEAIKDPYSIQKILIQNNLNNYKSKILKNAIIKSGISYSYVPEQKLHKYCKLNHQGFIAILSELKFSKLENIVDVDKKQLFLILDGINDVRNFGAILRSATGLDASGVIIGQTGSAPLNSIAIQASAGGAFHIPIIRVSHIKDAIYFLKSINVKVLGCSEKADVYVGNVDFKRSLGIVIGNESKGISRGVLEICDELIKIPINPKINSYNVSVACSIVLYEYFKQNN